MSGRYLALYVLALLVVVFAVEPERPADGVRVAGIAGAFAAAVAIIEIATRYQAGERRRYSPAVVWGMGISYLLAVAPLTVSVAERLGEPLSPYGVCLAGSLVLSGLWLSVLLDESSRTQRP